MKELVLSLFLFFSCNSIACTCIGGKASVEEETKRSDVVFQGKVVSIEKISMPVTFEGIVFDSISFEFNRVSFKVTSIYHGRIKQEIIHIITGLGNGDCGYVFEVDKEYIVYSKYRDRFCSDCDKVEKYLETNICTRTTSEVDSELIEIRKGKRRCR